MKTRSGTEAEGRSNSVRARGKKQSGQLSGRFDVSPKIARELLLRSLLRLGLLLHGHD